jgi:two component transcriptional regulator, luxR family
MPEIRVVIADDQQLLRQSLAHLLDAQTGIRVVGEAATGVEAVSLARELVPDVILMDIRMPQLDGIAATRSIVRDARLSEVRVVVLTMFGLDEYVFGALRSGASGFLLKDTTPDILINAVRTVAAGQALLAPSAMAALVKRWLPSETPDGRIADLTPRQTEILRLVARGLSNEQIERELHISHATCKTHISALLSRLHARDRAQLVIAAYESGLVSPGPAT